LFYRWCTDTANAKLICQKLTLVYRKICSACWNLCLRLVLVGRRLRQSTRRAGVNVGPSSRCSCLTERRPNPNEHVRAGGRAIALPRPQIGESHATASHASELFCYASFFLHAGLTCRGAIRARLLADALPSPLSSKIGNAKSARRWPNREGIMGRSLVKVAAH